MIILGAEPGAPGGGGGDRESWNAGSRKGGTEGRSLRLGDRAPCVPTACPSLPRNVSEKTV